jgi:hypothetical protein
MKPVAPVTTTFIPADPRGGEPSSAAYRVSSEELAGGRRNASAGARARDRRCDDRRRRRGQRLCAPATPQWAETCTTSEPFGSADASALEGES